MPMSTELKSTRGKGFKLKGSAKGPHGKMRRNSARKHSSSGDVPKVPQEDTSDGQPAPSKVPRGENS